MVISVSFNKRLPPGAAKIGRGTLAELMAKQRQSVEGTSQAMEMQTPTIMQGFGKLAQVAAGAFGERRAESELNAGRDELARLQSGISDEGATPAQIAEITRYDPEMGEQYRREAIQARVRAQELKQKEIDYQRDLTRNDFEYRRGVENETRIDTREAGQEGGINERERLEAEAADRAAQERKDAEHRRSLAEGQTSIVTGDEAVKYGGDPKRQYKIKADGTGIEDVTPEPAKTTYTYEPGTPDDYAKFRVPEKQPLKIKVGSDGSREPVGIGGGIDISSQDASRIAMAQEFTDQVPQILKEIDSGALTGPVDYIAGQFGSGRQGEIQRAIEQGADVITRHLTGAGKNLVEASEFANRYLPQVWNQSGDVRSKVIALHDALKAMEGGILTQEFDTWRELKKKGGGAGGAAGGVAAPIVGAEVDGYIFQGGDPSNPNSWKPKEAP